MLHIQLNAGTTPAVYAEIARTTEPSGTSPETVRR